MTPPTCSCGAIIKREGQQRTHCRACIENAALARSHTPENDPPPRRYPQEVRHLFDLVSKGPFPCAIVHAGGDYRVTRDYDYDGYEALRRIVLVCDENTTIEDIQREVA